MADSGYTVRSYCLLIYVLSFFIIIISNEIEKVYTGVIIFRIYNESGVPSAEFLLFKPNSTELQENWIPSINVGVEPGQYTLEVVHDEIFKKAGIRECDVDIISKFSKEIPVTVNNQNSPRTIIYFLAKVLKPNVKIRFISHQFKEFKWADVTDVEHLLMRAEQKEIIDAANEFLYENTFNV